MGTEESQGRGETSLHLAPTGDRVMETAGSLVSRARGRVFLWSGTGDFFPSVFMCSFSFKDEPGEAGVCFPLCLSLKNSRDQSVLSERGRDPAARPAPGAPACRLNPLHIDH